MLPPFSSQFSDVRFAGKVVRDASIGVYIDIGAEKDHEIFEPVLCRLVCGHPGHRFLKPWGDLSCHPNY